MVTLKMLIIPCQWVKLYCFLLKNNFAMEMYYFVDIFYIVKYMKLTPSRDLLLLV